LSSITAAVAAGCCAGPRFIHSIAATRAAPKPHFHIAPLSWPRRSVGHIVRWATMAMAAPMHATTTLANIPAPE
jgi:hypothetical protein